MAQGVAAIVVERAMYSNANGVVWAAGTDVVATKPEIGASGSFRDLLPRVGDGSLRPWLDDT